MRNYLLLSLLWLAPIFLFSQNQILSNQFRLDLLSVKDGLPANSANAIIQDRYGYIWIGSFGGLSKYDGYTFKNYQEDKDNPDSSLVNNYVVALHEDKQGYIWIGTMFKGLQRFDPITETFITYPSGTTGKPGIIDRYVTAITEDDLGNKWIGTINGLYRLSSPQGTFQLNDIELIHFSAKAYPDTLLQVLSDALTSDALVTGILQVGKNQIIEQPFSLSAPTTLVIAGSGAYGGSQAGLLDAGCFLSSQGDTLWNMAYPSTSVAPNSKKRSDQTSNRIKVSSLELAAGEYTLHYHSNDLHHYDQWFLPPFPAPYNMSKEEIPAYPQLWGIQVFSFNDSKKNWIKEQLHKSQAIEVVSGSTILDLHVDEQKDLWIATSGGLDRLSTVKKKITIQHLQAVHENNIASEIDFVNSIYKQKNGQILVHGHQINQQAKEYFLRIESMPHNEDTDTRLFFQSNAITESGEIMEDAASNLWLTSHSEGLFQLTPRPNNLSKKLLVNYPLIKKYTSTLDLSH